MDLTGEGGRLIERNLRGEDRPPLFEGEPAVGDLVS